MIDSHTHTHFSKHAYGTVAEVVEAALEKKIKVLTITDHAPFYVDTKNRLLFNELVHYHDEVQRARQLYRHDIKILLGLEIDYMLGSEAYSRQLIGDLELDFVIGAIHYIPVGNELVRVWDLPRLNEKAVLDSYFSSLEVLVTCGLFDSVGHADTLLRGVEETEFFARFSTLLHYFASGFIAYELNASGRRKSVYDLSKRMEGFFSCTSYPCQSIVKNLLSVGASFTIGSDAHKPIEVGAGIIDMLQNIQPLGLQTVSYFEQRRRIDVSLSVLLGEREFIRND